MATAAIGRLARIKQQVPAALEQLETGIEHNGSTFTADELEAQTAMVRDAEEGAAPNDGFRFTLPTLMIDDLYSVQAGAASFNIHSMRGHTRGDLVIHFPQLKLVATGD